MELIKIVSEKRRNVEIAYGLYEDVCNHVQAKINENHRGIEHFMYAQSTIDGKLYCWADFVPLNRKHLGVENAGKAFDRVLN